VRHCRAGRGGCAGGGDLPCASRRHRSPLERDTMIAKLAGILDSAGPDSAVIDVGGVGYLAFCSSRSLGRLPPPGGAARLLIETHVREDHIHLYGFVDTAERDWFRLLTTVQGVGARLALAMLSVLNPDALALAIFAQDKASLARADGVGAKLAARIVNELRDKVSGLISAAKSRAEALDHVLFAGPPGLGKTTLAQIVARELGVGFRATSGPVIQRAGDLAAILTNLQPRDVLFIDEIHRLAPPVEEILYPAMEDFQLDLIIGEGPGARSIRIDLPPFTLVGATTRSGLITRPLRERFGIPLRLLFYEPGELAKILTRGARLLTLDL